MNNRHSSLLILQEPKYQIRVRDNSLCETGYSEDPPIAIASPPLPIFPFSPFLNLAYQSNLVMRTTVHPMVARTSRYGLNPPPTNTHIQLRRTNLRSDAPIAESLSGTANKRSLCLHDAAASCLLCFRSGFGCRSA